MTPKPEKTPRCDCQQVTEWCWDPYDEAWYQSRCWHCLETEWMKTGNPIIKSLLPWDTDMTDRFIEIVTNQTHFLKTVTVIPFKGKDE